MHRSSLLHARVCESVALGAGDKQREYHSGIHPKGLSHIRNPTSGNFRNLTSARGRVRRIRTLLVKTYAIVFLSDLAVRRFDYRDELKVAIAALQKNNVQFQAFKYHSSTGIYTPIEIA
jgi:hypothetical protein